MNVRELNIAFGIPRVLHFEQTPSGLVRAQVTTASAEATIYLQGAHLTHWQPAGHLPAIFTGTKNDFVPGKVIRGGIPVIFPWFSTYAGVAQEGIIYPFHGFANISLWTLASASQRDEDLHLSFLLVPNEQTRLLGFDHYRLAYALRIGRTLTLELTVHNDGVEPLCFAEAFHTYYAVEDVGSVSLDGLAGASYLDSVDNFTPKQQTTPQLHFRKQTDSIYTGSTATCLLHDPQLNRSISIAKSGSRSTVVWNPGEALGETVIGLSPGEWRNFLCVETANVHGNAITLEPGATHTMQSIITLAHGVAPGQN